MFYYVYKNREQEIEAGKFESLEDVGVIVQNLYDVGCQTIFVTTSPRNPQLEDTSYITTITFTQNGVVQFLLMGDFLSFDENGNAVVWNEEDFLEQYELIGE